MRPLRELQLRFEAILAAAVGAAVAPGSIDQTLLGLVRERGELGGAARVQIYRDMYRARLIDVLREDFPRVVATVGDEEFEALAGRYLLRHPSRHPSVRYVGDRFSGFVGAEGVGPPFLADLARLEWARGAVFDAPDALPLRRSDLQAIPAVEWPALELRSIPACRILECAWPAHEIWAAAGQPTSGEPPAWEPRPVTIRVWREGYDVSHAAIGPVERRLLPRLERGAPLAELCSALEGDLEPEAAAREVGGLLMRWLEDGILARGPV